MTHLGWDELEQLRRSPGRSVLLFVTDRCPVGCAHCSVDSRRTSPTITDFGRYERIVDWIADHPRFEVVGISGGEPFVERRGLTMAVRRIRSTGKRVVLYTSGVWATRPTPPAWIREVLAQSSTVFLSTDAFHQQTVSEPTFINASRAIAAEGGWIVVQVIDSGEMLQRARSMLRRALGDCYEEFAEVHAVPGLTAGRGGEIFAHQRQTPGHAFAPCTMLASQTIRYDGHVSACCNESVIMGWGPPGLRESADTGDELTAATEGLGDRPILRAIGGVGPGALTGHPRFADLADEQFGSICQLCWKLVQRDARDPDGRRVLDAINAVLSDPAD